MKDFVIVGAGITGLIAARILHSQDKEFIGLEREDKLGGRADTGHHRLLNEHSVDYLKKFSSIDWLRINEEPKERKKGEWVTPEIPESENEKFYLASNFFQPKTTFSNYVQNIAEPIKDKFEFRKIVDKIDTEKNTISCQDGSEYPYKTLIWCTDLALLRKLSPSSVSEVSKNLKKGLVKSAGLNIDLSLKTPLFEFQNSIVFPFRFKDLKFKAIGIQDSLGTDDKSGAYNLHWIVFLEEELTEDREELAKIIRSLKRELQKEFPQFIEIIKHEKITFLPRLSGDQQVEMKSLRVSNNIIYLGPQSRMKDESEDAANSLNIDRALLNCRTFEESFNS